MPDGKPAGVRCLHLAIDYRCELFHDPRRPAVCASLRPSEDMCGTTREYALEGLADLERRTCPDASDQGPPSVPAMTL